MAFGLFKKKTDPVVSVVAPIDGQVVPLEQVPDQVFSSRVLGDGVAIIPNDTSIMTVLAPMDGECESATDAYNAFVIRGENGIEILVHVGLEAIVMEGRGFHVLKSGSVKAGEPVLDVDVALLVENNINPITMIVINTKGNYRSTENVDITVAAGKDEILRFQQ